MTFDERAREKQGELIRSICEKLGADEEMTGLVLASYRHDPEVLEALLTAGGDLVGYVRSKLTRWERIFREN